MIGFFGFGLCIVGFACLMKAAGALAKDSRNVSSDTAIEQSILDHDIGRLVLDDTIARVAHAAYT